MAQYTTVIKRVRSGSKVRFFQDHFGGTYVEVPLTIFGWPRSRVKLTQTQLAEVKALLRERRRGTQTAVADTEREVDAAI